MALQAPHLTSAVLLEVLVCRGLGNNSTLANPFVAVRTQSAVLHSATGKDVTSELDVQTRGLPAEIEDLEQKSVALLTTPVLSRGRAGSQRTHTVVYQWNQEFLLPFTPQPLSITLYSTTGGLEEKTAIGSVKLTFADVDVWGLKWYELKHEDTVIGEILVGCTPTVTKTKSSSKHTIQKRESTKFWDFKKKRMDKGLQALRNSIETYIGKYVTSKLPGPTKPTEASEDLMRMLEILKTERGRAILAELLQPVDDKLLRELSKGEFQQLRDIVFVSLREANNTGDFRSCKMLLDLSYRFYCHDTPKDASGPSVAPDSFLYCHVKKHEVFRNTAFWETVFLDLHTAQRQSMLAALNGAEDIKEQTIVWNQMSEAEQAAFHTRESDMVKRLLFMFGTAMTNFGMAADKIISFLSNMVKVFETPLPAEIVESVKEIIVIRFSPLRLGGSSNSSLHASLMAAPIDSQVEYAHTGSIVGKRAALMDEISAAGRMRARSSLIRVHSRTAEVEPRTSTRGDWTQYVTSYGAKYYHNEVTNEIRLIAPEEFQEEEKKKEKGKTDVISQPRSVFGEVQKCKVVDVEFIGTVKDFKGTLFCSNYRVCFMAYDRAFNANMNNRSLSNIGVHSIGRVEFAANEMTFWCKDIRTLKFRVPDTRTAMAQGFIKQVRKLAFPGQDGAFAFSYKDPVGAGADGWHVYDVAKEMARLGVLNTGDWRISDINKEYKYASTYPARLVVPTAVTDDDLWELQKFRSKARIPTLIYRHGRTNAVLLRSSQPMVGLTGKRNAADEKLLQCGLVKLILDSRPKANAVANQAKGGGYENVMNYKVHHKTIKLEFMGIENIHVMRESLHRLQLTCETVSSKSGTWLSDVEASAWLRHVKCVLLASVHMARQLDGYTSILVHCSDGWDRTAQMAALTQVMLDPYYRTIEGICVLIQKEWCSMGHKFGHRIGHCEDNYSSSERSPIFLQFLDCMYQIMLQFPCSFQYNQDLLTFLASHAFKCKFGTFLYNNERERNEHNVKTRTVSIWTHVLRNNDFVNPFYCVRESILPVSCDPRRLQVWPFYFRADQRARAKESLTTRARSLLHIERDSAYVKNLWLEDKLQAVREQQQEAQQYAKALEALLAKHNIQDQLPRSPFAADSASSSSTANEPANSSSASSSSPKYDLERRLAANASARGGRRVRRARAIAPPSFSVQSSDPRMLSISLMHSQVKEMDDSSPVPIYSPFATASPMPEDSPSTPTVDSRLVASTGPRSASLKLPPAHHTQAPSIDVDPATLPAPPPPPPSGGGAPQAERVVSPVVDAATLPPPPAPPGAK